MFRRLSAHRRRKSPGATVPPNLHATVSVSSSRVRYGQGLVRILDVPHVKRALHRHELNRVVGHLTCRDSKMTTPDGKVDESKHEAGRINWAGRPRARCPTAWRADDSK